MKKNLLTVSLILLGLISHLYSQQIEPERGVAHKQATIKVSSIEQTPGDGKIKLKTPNPYWQPPDWDYDREKVIYRQPTSKISHQKSKIRQTSPPPDTSFQGLIDNGTSIPPDVNGAAGPNHLMQTLNTEVRISNKNGEPLFTTTLSAFWSALPGAGSTFDPKIVYDPYLDCWIMVTPSGSGIQSKMYFAISTSSDPLGEWHMYWFDPDTTKQTWFDYPNLGFNKNWISIGGIQRNAQFDPIDYVVFAIDKVAAYNGEENPTVSRFTTQLGSAIVPAFTYDPEQEELYLISTGDGNDAGFGYVNLFKLNGSAQEPNFSLIGSVGVPEPWENWSYEYHGDFLPQLGSDSLLNSIDARMQTMVTRNDKLWAVHHIYLPADDPERCAVQWYCFDTTGVILERDRIDDPDNGVSFAFPSIAVNANEDVLIGHGVFSSNRYAGSAYSFKAYYDDASTTRDFFEYKAGLAPYYKTFGGDRNRWGDYSAVFVDPDYDVNFWAMHEYAELPSGGDQWGTWWAYYRPSFPPVADFESDEIIIPVGETVNFSDLTLGVPETWKWTFEGGTPTTSETQNPDDILYDAEGVFNVTLIATNQLGTDTIIKEGWITASTTILPEVNFMADNTVPCTDDTVSFFDQTEYSPIQWNWEFEPTTVTFVNGTDENSQDPMVVFNEATLYTVTLTSWNLNGSSDLTKTDMVSAGGYEPFYKETFEKETFRSNEWIIENPDMDITWEYVETGGTNPGNVSAGIDFYNYFSFNERDRLISPPFNLENISSAYLQFEHAYAKRHADFTDSLLVYISDDCRTNWTKVFFGGEDGSGNFATHEPADGFWPMVADDWCMSGWGASCTSIDLSPWVGKSNVQIAFESWSAFGNPMFIDNIEIGQFVSMDEIGKRDEEANIYPNPANDGFTILLKHPGKFQKVELFNHLGQILLSRDLKHSPKEFRIQKQKDWKPGLYYITLSGHDIRLVKKLSLY